MQMMAFIPGTKAFASAVQGLGLDRTFNLDFIL